MSDYKKMSGTVSKRCHLSNTGKYQIMDGRMWTILSYTIYKMISNIMNLVVPSVSSAKISKPHAKSALGELWKF
jgi:hypothetical protein